MEQMLTGQQLPTHRRSNAEGKVVVDGEGTYSIDPTTGVEHLNHFQHLQEKLKVLMYKYQ